MDELLVVESARNAATGHGVGVLLHAFDAVLGLLRCQVLQCIQYTVLHRLQYTHGIQLLGSDVRTELLGQGAEGHLDLLGALYVLRLLGDHEGHVLLQCHIAIAINICIHK